MLDRAGEIRERQLELVLAAGSETQKLRFAADLADETNLILSFHLVAAPDDPVATRRALTTLLRRKGRVLDATASSVNALRTRLDSADRAAFERLNQSRARVATLTFRAPGELPRSRPD